MTVHVPDGWAVRDDCAKESDHAGERLFCRLVRIVQRLMRVPMRDGCKGE
jgi:hypothetical protein